MTSNLPTVIVPVHNALEALDACLASLDRTLPAGAAVLVADDASSDPRVAPMLATWVSRTALAARVVRREKVRISLAATGAMTRTHSVSHRSM